MRGLWGAKTRIGVVELQVHGLGHPRVAGILAARVLVCPYLVLGRILQFLILLARVTGPRRLRSSLLRQSGGRAATPVNRPDLGDGDRVVLAALSRLLPRRSWAFLRDPSNVAALAPQPG